MSERETSSADGWAAAAAGWERQRELIAAIGAPVTARLVALLDPRPGQTILELACGAGEVGLAVAETLHDGLVIQSDLVPGMVDAARREAIRRGVVGIEHRVLDAERLDLADESVDGVVCRWGYMLLPDPVAGLAETRRVLRVDGRVAFAVWAESSRNPWASVIGRALVTLGLMEAPDRGAPGPFRLGKRTELLTAVRSAGLEVVVDAEVETVWAASSSSAYWDSSLDLSTSVRHLVDGLSSEQLASVRSLVERSLDPYRAAEGVAIPGVSRVVLAVKPSA